MRNSIIYLLVVGLIVVATSCNNQNGNGNVSIESTSDSVSYALGYSIGNNVITQFPDIDPNIVGAAVSDVYAKKEITMFADEQAAGAFINGYLQKQMVIEGQKNLEEGNKFLEENGKRDGVTTTESGLQYEIIAEGTGEKPVATDKVRVHYHGTTIDGTVFDSSVDKGEPLVLSVNGVIPGWTEALQLMPVGSKWKLYIPAEIAYGANPRPGGPIKANMALIFEVELLEIVKE